MSLLGSQWQPSKFYMPLPSVAHMLVSWNIQHGSWIIHLCRWWWCANEIHEHRYHGWSKASLGQLNGVTWLIEVCTCTMHCAMTKKSDEWIGFKAWWVEWHPVRGPTEVAAGRCNAPYGVQVHQSCIQHGHYIHCWGELGLGKPVLVPMLSSYHQQRHQHAGDGQIQGSEAFEPDRGCQYPLRCQVRETSPCKSLEAFEPWRRSPCIHTCNMARCQPRWKRPGPVIWLEFVQCLVSR